ncbi:hypothetical protein [Streptomyces rubellomurinus]|uniref:Uncharacterized protein n=1 Tax=Streptomyces rubellomurinus (strain ATCC 31215) TaxID=359131 RepID=A0A0F2T601_STRR3|nr:hypothetical protein [Streptomyces rubellomurinus]KJS58639.1 hypothetical protein VM95_32060 [Streptomyces rubellomurinus]
MGIVLVFLLVLVGAVVGACVVLTLRERSRSYRAEGWEGALIERRRTAEAARMRAAYASVSVHESSLGNEELFIPR